MEERSEQISIMAILKSHNDYALTPLNVEERPRQTVGQPLAFWIIDPAADTPEEVEAGRVLRKRCLVSYVMTLSQYKARLLSQLMVYQFH